MFYLTSAKYVGPNARHLENDYNKIVYGHYVDIQSVPGRRNMSKEPCVDGWLGTTNDWAEYAHGAFETLDAARAARAGLFDEIFVAENDPREDWPDETVIERVYVGPGENYYDARQWSYDDGLRQITAATTDDDLKTLAEESKAAASCEGVILWGDVEAVLREIRADKQSELDDDEQPE
jgi:hypothetical protein